jgi:hypothetical protein
MGYKLKKDLIISKNNKRINVFVPEESIIVSLNQTASFIFNKIKKGMKNKKIIELMITKYNLTKKHALVDLTSIVKKLKDKKIVTD